LTEDEVDVWFNCLLF